MTVTDSTTGSDIGAATPETADRIRLLEAKIDLLAARIGVLTEDAEQRMQQRRMLDELLGDVNRFSGDALATLTDRLAEADRKGYFTVARAGGRIADKVVTRLDEEDLDQLGDNVVTILDTLREVTQPELLALLGRMVGAVRAEQDRVEQEQGPAPSLFGLAKELRDPDVRRGMARALHTLRAVSVRTGPTSISDPSD